MRTRWGTSRKDQQVRETGDEGGGMGAPVTEGTSVQSVSGGYPVGAHVTGLYAGVMGVPAITL
jgi:hypothetical protein